ncbi:MAG TPA: hypothetical protein DE312_01995 [Gallionella sp.]|nr:response regulator [Gallionella sp.]OGS67294.1 MAG: hypothetical protein A2Z87_03670 [Gallionellales bacterium GWA2_54_124]OGT18019.1 MAG: hypothetical protein A2522_08280 [Gallionellales bacterium RIFOXYD12_FULL_53_10]HCI52097.1 hypothetical protein [Gallionella sp.]
MGNSNWPDVTGRVLVVDDDKITRILHRTLLSNQFDVETASSGEEALKMCSERLPDLILLDVIMPDMDGYETCLQIREFTDIPIIFATGNETLDEHMAAFDAGGDDLITKPVTKEILLRKISRAIARKHETHTLQSEKNSLQNMAMNFLSAVGESGVLQQFMQASLICGTPRDLGNQLVEAIKNFGLECSVLIRDSNAEVILTSHNNPSEIEKAILLQSTGMGRIFQFKQKIVVNYNHVSVIVNNMPMDDDEKSGRVRDNITMLAEMTDSLCDNVLMRQTSHSLAEQFQIAMSTGYSTLETLRELNQRAQVDTRILLQELVDNIEKTFTWLGISRNQEKMISETMFVSVDKILALLESANSKSDEKLNEALSCLRNDDTEGTVDLF